jgi:hypothetical protein
VAFAFKLILEDWGRLLEKTQRPSKDQEKKREKSMVTSTNGQQMSIWRKLFNGFDHEG